MGAMLKSLIGSKKAAAAIAAVIMSLIGKKVGLDEESVTNIVYALIAYMVAQGVADHGKEAVKAKESL